MSDLLPMGSTPLSNRYRVDANHRNVSHFFVRQLRPARAAPTTATDAHLEALLAAWPQLSEEMQAAVRAMVEAAV